MLELGKDQVVQLLAYPLLLTSLMIYPVAIVVRLHERKKLRKGCFSARRVASSGEWLNLSLLAAIYFISLLGAYWMLPN